VTSGVNPTQCGLRARAPRTTRLRSALLASTALTTAGAELHLTQAWSVLAKFDGEFAKGSETYAGTGTLRYVW